MEVRKIVLSAFFIALSFVGANIKIMGTIAFDSMPGFLGALILGPVYGACIGAFGHFLTALLAGFYLTPPVHAIIMITMGVTMAVFAAVYRKFEKNNRFSWLGALVAGLGAVMMNGPIGLLVLTPLLLPVMGKAGMMSLLPVLSTVAALNILVALLLYWLLQGKIKPAATRRP
ncbi:membrane protein [Sporomusaceae bacterium FL31]|nr:membrane protein [Sporomusaceae bacterium FL31]GCE35297.1 membrane protein [Sporomusaceae bacterium]